MQVDIEVKEISMPLAEKAKEQLEKSPSSAVTSYSNSPWQKAKKEPHQNSPKFREIFEKDVKSLIGSFALSENKPESYLYLEKILAVKDRSQSLTNSFNSRKSEENQKKISRIQGYSTCHGCVLL
ncbi:unnamed protein product [Blepharisma stoltei]|uniref:Uncharacterized protein n=1 Tax=Blepharisma stoltei TaxID=1481888 RepID=A0AAU9JES6_9CILI|nr:unnamed protein product [Blepharisma stoltei]